MVSMTGNLPFVIPHLKYNQSVKDWRISFTAATLLFTEEQRLNYLPIAVDRSTPDQKWAIESTKMESLKDALDELELRLDGKRTRLQAMTYFFDMKYHAQMSLDNISEVFFNVWEAGKDAVVTTDVIALKFLQLLEPVGTKIFPEVKRKIKEDMSDEDLISLFDVARKKLANMRPVDTEDTLSAMVDQNTVDEIPTWAEELKIEVAALQERLHRCSRTKRLPEEAVFTVKESKMSCSICRKTNHTEKTCFKRICSNCSGTGHDTAKCTSKTKVVTASNR